MLVEDEGGTCQRDPSTPLAVRVLGLNDITAACDAVDVGGDALTEVEELRRPRLGRRLPGLAQGSADVSGLRLLDEKARLEDNEIVGVDLDYNEISGGGKGMLFLVASGTAVRLR